MPRNCRSFFSSVLPSVLPLALCSLWACNQQQPDAGQGIDKSGAAQEPAAPAAPAAPVPAAPAAEAPTAQAPSADPAKPEPAAPAAPAAETDPKAPKAAPHADPAQPAANSAEPAQAHAPAAAPAAEAPPPSAAAVAGPCGEKGQPPCPLQGWMEEHLQNAADDQDLIALAEGLAHVPHFVPDPGWNAGAQGWTTIAESGAAAAKAGDFATAKQACKTCHKAWRAKYKDSFRLRALPK